MPRQLRYDLVGCPQHVVQRGNNRQRTFFARRDRVRYLAWAREAARDAGCEIHAYVLMSNHVHLLVTPREPLAIAPMMQSLGRRYVRYLNDRRGRTGTLWDGRYKASLVATGDYLWNCYRYIELNPVRAGIVDDPAAYPWSSFRRNALGQGDPLICDHADYATLGDDVNARTFAYRDFFREGLDSDTLMKIRSSLERCDPYGPEGFGRPPGTSATPEK